ncbi:unnamed protein product [Discula destructiva]
MHLSALQLFLAVAASASASASASADLVPRSVPILRRQAPAAPASGLWVSEVPSSPKPYAVRHYGIPGTSVAGQVYRFPVTGPSSDNAFTLISTASPGAGSLGVLPHTHQLHYENFFCLSGRFQLWTADADTYENEEARLFTPGDFGAVPHNTTHTFQVLDPATDMVGIIQPGGFEELFYALSTGNFTPATYSPYALNDYIAYDAPGVSGDASTIASLQVFDVYAQLAFSPSREIVNGSYSSTGNATGWHEGTTVDALAADSKTPYFVAKDYGNKYLSSEAGFYQIIEPLVTPTQSDGNFTISTIIMSERLSNETAMAVVGNTTIATTAATGSGSTALTGHSAFEVLEGLLTFEMSGETIQLATGDVVFVPAGTAFSYSSEVPYTKVLYISQGADGLATRLIASGESGWEYPVFPAYA